MNPSQEILKHWAITEPVQPAIDGGLINDTYIVGDPPSAILQHVNPIFGPAIHKDIDVITAHLEAAGLTSPRLVRTIKNELCVESNSGAWRLLSFVPGTTVHKIERPSQAASAARLVGQFHRATASLDHKFNFVRPGAHDTALHMRTLTAALDEADGHALESEVRALGQDILSRWKTWEGDLDLPQRICHGDLKISNIRFAEDRETALCLLDFDTFSHQTIAVEMGDAWRSWCNPAGEDDLEKVRFDLDIFEASANAWLHSGPELSQQEAANLVPGIERICLELAARFCADAVRCSYFKEDTSRFPQRGRHNLYRAAGQFKLGCSAREHRTQAEAIVKSR